MAETSFSCLVRITIVNSRQQRHELNSPVYASRHLIHTTSHNTETRKEEKEIELKHESLMTNDDDKRDRAENG